MDPFIGEIRMFAGTYAPQGWAFCDGRLLSINQYDALYALLGTTYGGDGTMTFALPDLRSRIPVHRSPTYPQGMTGGAETVTLTRDHLAGHTHATGCFKGPGTASVPANDTWAANSDLVAYSDQGANAVMNPRAVTPAGGNQPHDNMPPYTVVNYIIALEGVYPPQP